MKAPKELLAVARVLAGLSRKAAFVGGMVRPLLITDPAAGGSRATKDVDLIVEVHTLVEYYELSDELRGRRLVEGSEGETRICRWMFGDVPVDIMPTEPGVLGFGNAWYTDSLKSSRSASAEGIDVPIIDAVHFLATKLEAWLARGEDDLFHHDLEDVFAVVDGRAELFGEMQAADAELRGFVAGTVASLLSRSGFFEALPGHLAPDAASQDRIGLLTERLQAIAVLEGGGPEADVDVDPVPIELEASEASRAPWIAVSSAILAAIQYEPSTGRLVVRFRTGRVYWYAGVSQNVFNALRAAGSKGSFFAKHIRGRYRYGRLG